MCDFSSFSTKPRQAQLRDQLIDENDKTNRADKTSKKRSAEDTVQKTQTAQTGNKNHSARHGGDNAGNLCIELSILVAGLSLVDAGSHNLANQ